jgi:transposase-like protein
MSRYTREAKEKILRSRGEGESIAEMSVRIGVSKTSLYKWALELSDPSPISKFTSLIVENSANTEYKLTIQNCGTVLELSGDITPHYLRILLGW